MAGQTRKLSDARVNAVLNALEHGCTREAAAGAADVTRMTLYRWIEADVTLRDAVEKAEQKAEAAFTFAVAAAVPKNWQAAAWWLERRKHESYARREKVEMTVDLRDRAAKMGEAFGLDPDALMAEAEAVLAGR